ncbi:TPA: hypothetical protein RSS07_005169 [Klebsiella pneumoniae]|uniref:hypothetical protein n=1 Tax=Klebsiella pneumoniae TaxID=573 RepID=UPI0009BBC6F4|nr:hypothetical protein [Klebsiella pneumoniae]SLR83623.1 Uncharacterised protein [Klebsiella pneumoniae]SYE18000.1 Uncharacterised protein [Klebsiella pneumoniae]HBR5320150.1 hypothetical protein [Klebsiella pneumoniae]HDZ1216196.1 hypothetical protein [Klebsiella pneumoniae]HDZ2580395.1 hypothetical protein [Klebsiella pneumoniae]
MEDETELTEPPFETWFRDVVELVKNGGHSMDIVAYKGEWVDYFSDGLTPENALSKRIVH